MAWAFSLAFSLPALGATARADIPAFWRSLAQCETGGRWDWGARHRPGEGPRFEGGLGIYAGTWTLWREQTGVSYEHAYQAPPAVQVAVASWGLAHGGYWGCLRHIPHSTFPQLSSLHLWLAAPHLV